MKILLFLLFSTFLGIFRGHAEDDLTNLSANPPECRLTIIHSREDLLRFFDDDSRLGTAEIILERDLDVWDRAALLDAHYTIDGIEAVYQTLRMRLSVREARMLIETKLIGRR